MLLKDERQHKDSKKNFNYRRCRFLHGNLNIAFPTDIKQKDNFMLIWTLNQIKTFKKYYFHLMTPLMQYD